MGIYETKIFTDVATNLIEDVIKGAWSKVKKSLLIWKMNLILLWKIFYPIGLHKAIALVRETIFYNLQTMNVILPPLHHRTLPESPDCS